MKVIGYVLLFLCSALSVYTQAEVGSTGQNFVKNRYAPVEPLEQKIELLAVRTTIQFPQSIKTVGEAIDTLLLRSGYRLASLESSDPMLRVLLASPLPAVHREFHEQPIETILRVLASEAWVLVEDPVRRLISFELNHLYESHRYVGSFNDLQEQDEEL
ncbi:hypothetical protein [Hahella ganghwensis]|uniref:PFGI-1 class ICE element type IV pilus protein PilL2 n=1 Tax=Hahella ganghwensis TaxID=286420 RepID=UPI00037C218C|nr:hypothetical protein [Hahella ganghwensis]